MGVSLFYVHTCRHVFGDRMVNVLPKYTQYVHLIAVFALSKMTCEVVGWAE